MEYSAKQISKFSKLLSESLERAEAIIEAASIIIPFEAAFCVINRRNARPLHLCDSYSSKGSSSAVHNYIENTYLLNPVYNSFLNGLNSGLYRMRDLAPDQWHSDARAAYQNITIDQTEEIGYLTEDWPEGLEELVIVHRLSDHYMAEISLAMPSKNGGFSDEMLAQIEPFVPMIGLALNSIYHEQKHRFSSADNFSVLLSEFGRDQLTPRESEVIQFVLKGHSSLSIGLNLDISLPTVKSHRKNAYAKLGIATQQELFTLFLHWQHQQLGNE